MPFSLAELRHRANNFARRYADSHNEKSDDQNFVRDLLGVFPNPAAGGAATLAGAAPGAAVRVPDTLGQVVLTATVGNGGTARLG